MSQPPVFYKNPSVATILSFFFMGLGQLYNGQIAKGIIFMILYLLSLLLISVLIGIITTPICWIFGMVDANQSAKAVNAKLAATVSSSSALQMTKRCPQCAEEIKLEAVVCRYCNHRFDPQDVSRDVERSRQQDLEARSPVEPSRMYQLGKQIGQVFAQQESTAAPAPTSAPASSWHLIVDSPRGDQRETLVVTLRDIDPSAADAVADPGGTEIRTRAGLSLSEANALMERLLRAGFSSRKERDNA